jgi:AraC-like DNA-binding protein
VEGSGFVLSTWESKHGVHELAVRGGRGEAERLVRRYVGYRERADGLTRGQMANAGVALILAFGDPLHVGYVHESWAAFGAFVVGNHTRPALTALAGDQHGVQVDLTPEGACALLQGAVQDLTDRVVPLEEALGRFGTDLVGRLADLPSWAERFAALDEAIGGQQPLAGLDPEVRWVWQRLNACHGNARIDSLVDETGWSRRHLTRKFEQQLGLRPKTLARLARFAYSLQLMRGASNDSSLARVAARAGYYDQAHFNREFREFAGCTPRQHLAGSDGDPDVQFVQDDQQVPAVASSS